jgi:hypothetical protein
METVVLFPPPSGEGLGIELSEKDGMVWAMLNQYAVFVYQKKVAVPTLKQQRISTSSTCTIIFIRQECWLSYGIGFEPACWAAFE